jgi:hypothetical protein
MDVLVVTAVCVAGLAAATFIAFRWGGLAYTPPTEPQAGKPLMLRLLRTGTIGMLGGMAAGALVGGLGARLMMRVLAATSGDSAQGLLTEADERVGRITTDGTLGIVLFVGVFGGLVGGLLYVVLRRWLPHPAWHAGLSLGSLLFVVFARLDPLSPDNRDFTILHPTWLAVVLIAVLFLLFGVTVAPLIERLDRGYPRHPAAYAPLLLLGLTGPMGIIVGALVVTSAYLAAQAHRRPSVRVGQTALLLVGAAGSAWTGAGIFSILT